MFGVRFESRLLSRILFNILSRRMYANCNSSTVDETSALNIQKNIQFAWNDVFIQLINIVGRTKSSMMLLLPAWLEIFYRKVAYHISRLVCDLKAGVLPERNMFNVDNAHFLVHLHTYQTLAKHEENKVKYAEAFMALRP